MLFRKKIFDLGTTQQYRTVLRIADKKLAEESTHFFLTNCEKIICQEFVFQPAPPEIKWSFLKSACLK